MNRDVTFLLTNVEYMLKCKCRSRCRDCKCVRAHFKNALFVHAPEIVTMLEAMVNDLKTLYGKITCMIRHSI